MGSQKSKSHTSKSTMGAAANIASRSNITERRYGLIQNYLLIWVDGNIDLNNEDCENTLSQLRDVVRRVEHCTTPAECIEFLNKMDDEKAFIISSGALGQNLIPDIHGMSQVRAIYIFCGNKAGHEGWANTWPKIQGVFTAIKPICESLKKVARECDHDTIPMSFVPKSKSAATTSDQNNLDQLPPSFMYSTLFKEIILEIDEDDNKSISDLVAYCRKKTTSEQQLKNFQTKYHQKSPVWWYSCENFLYPMLNYALRSLDMETMTKLGFFIRSLHLQLQELHNEQASTYNKKFIVYRGQGLSREDFQHLTDTKGGLLSFNNFLSTSTDQKVAMGFLDRSIEKYNENIGVLFIMTIDPRKMSQSTSTPFALIDDYSAMPMKEEEILFSMHTVFRVDDIQQMPTTTGQWEVRLTLTDDNDPQLDGLTKYMKDTLVGSTGWHRLGDLMIKVGHFNQAEELYNQLLTNASNDNDRAHIYHQLGWLKDDQGEYKKAAAFYEQYLAIKRRTLPEDDPSLSPTYNNIGLVYKNMGEYSKALEFYEKSHKLKEKALPLTHPDLAISFSNIGQVYQNMGEYSKALQFYDKSHKIKKNALPPTHPDLAISHLNFAACYEKLGDYTRALKALQKALQIQEKTFEKGNQDFRFTYSWFGRVYRSMKEYSKALDYFQKCLVIVQKILPEKHPDLGIIYSNIGDVYQLQGDYEKALLFHQKGLSIQENVQCDPLDCATTYVNLGETYREMKDYTTAMTYYQKGMKIREKKLGKNHPDLGIIYHYLAKLYLATRQYSMAMKNAQQAIKIGEEKLPTNHPHLVDYRETFEKIRKNM